MLRHASANHRRETLAWAKRRQRSAERLAIFIVWHNCGLWRHQKRPGVTPAMAAGITSRRLTPQDLLKRRLFVTRQALPPRYEDYYWSRVPTPALGVNRRHELKRAY